VSLAVQTSSANLSVFTSGPSLSLALTFGGAVAWISSSAAGGAYTAPIPPAAAGVSAALPEERLALMPSEAALGIAAAAAALKAALSPGFAAADISAGIAAPTFSIAPSAAVTSIATAAAALSVGLASAAGAVNIVAAQPGVHLPGMVNVLRGRGWAIAATAPVYRREPTTAFARRAKLSGKAANTQIRRPK
jgi:hypothetical protein